jgi:hypothetical protein
MRSCVATTERLTERLRKAEIVIDVQNKATLLGLAIAETEAL